MERQLVDASAPAARSQGTVGTGAGVEPPQTSPVGGPASRLQWEQQPDHYQHDHHDRRVSKAVGVGVAIGADAAIVSLPQPLGYSHAAPFVPSRRAAAPSTPPGLLLSASPQQEPGSTQYLAKLVRLSRCQSFRRPKPVMADFLSSFNLGADNPVPADDSPCDSAEDLQMRLREILESKVTPTRAEHVAIALDLSAAAQFTLGLSEDGNDTPEGLNKIESSLGGARSEDADGESVPHAFRVVQVREALADQAQDDSALQRSVASHIVHALGAVDGSEWAAEKPARDSDGWTCTYMCKHSRRHWDGQKAMPTKAIIGEFTHGEPDPALLARPAFDCRGCITIVFSRRSRSALIKYNHTPIHKTVGELVVLLKPPSRQVAPKPQILKKPPSAKKRRDPTLTPIDASQSKKKRKKKNGEEAQGDEQEELQPDGPVMPPDYPGAAPIEGLSQPTPSYGTGQPQPDGTEPYTEAFNQYPQSLVQADAEATQVQEIAQSAAAMPFPVNVSTEEAARRKEVGRSLLSSAGVDPDSLSADQFNIFANQSPELQKESLNMLARYGAERLRIVHPGNRDSSASPATSSPPPADQTTQPTPSGPMTTKELVPEPNDSSRNGTGKVKLLGKSRVACFPCKGRKTKCPRERPACSECQNEGLSCEYAPQKPRTRKSNAAAAAAEDDQQDEAAEEGEQTLLDASMTDIQPSAGDEAHGNDFPPHSQIPVDHMLTSSMDSANDGAQQSANYFESSSGLALPQPDLMEDLHQPHVERTGLALLQTQSQTQTQTQTYYSPTIEPSNLTRTSLPAAAALQSPKQRRQKAKGPANSNSRQSAPTGIVETETRNKSASQLQHSPASAWPTPVGTAQNTAPVATSPSIPQQTIRGGHSREPSQQMAREAAQMNSRLQDAALLSQAALRHSNLSPKVAAAMQEKARVSPFQLTDKHRTKSRQGQRGQSETPLADHPLSRTSVYQPPATSTHHTNADSNGSFKPVNNMANNYNNYSGVGNAQSQPQSTNRGAYESFQHQRHPSNSRYPTYDNDRGSLATLSVAGQTMPSRASSSNTQGNQLGSPRDGHARLNSNVSYDSFSQYGQDVNSGQQATAAQQLSMRTHSQRSRSSLGALNQTQQGFSSYSGQVHQQQQQQQQQQQGQGGHHNAWYGMNSSSNSANSANQGTNYSWKMPGDQWDGVP